MAEQYSNVVRLFSEIADRLRNFPIENSNNLSNQSNDNTSNTLVSMSSIAATSNAVHSTSNSSGQPTANGVSRTQNELMSLFPHHFTSRAGRNTDNRTTSKKRRRKGQKSTRDNKKVEYLTRKFVCLADKDQQEVPDKVEMRELLTHGLGEIKAPMPEDAGETTLRSKLTELFPKLKESGGFELMYAECRRRDLTVIPRGPDGHSMKYLASFIGQGKIYVRPIKQDLLVEDESIETEASTQKEECMNCKLMVDVHLLREHLEMCTEYNNATEQLQDNVADIPDEVLERGAFQLERNESSHIEVTNQLPNLPSDTSNMTTQSVHHSAEEYANYININDVEVKSMLQDFVNCSDEVAFSSLIDQHGETIAHNGYPKIYRSSFSDKSEMIESQLRQYFIYGVHAEISQFFKGLNSIGNLGDLILKNHQLFHVILGNQNPPLTKALFMSLYQLERSEEGSNNRSKEDSTIYCFEVFLQDLEECEISTLSLEGLLVFATGADCVPPLGFHKPITIAFYDFEENSRRLPYASTCGLYLFLPRGFEDLVGFSQFMKEALLGCHDFGKL